MNCLGRSTRLLRAPRFGKQLRRSHDDSLSPAEAMRDIRLWKVGSFVGLAFLAAFFAKLVLFTPHRHYEFIEYPHLNILCVICVWLDLTTSTKEYPWGDGKTGMFHNLFGNPYAHDDDEE